MKDVLIGIFSILAFIGTFWLMGWAMLEAYDIDDEMARLRRENRRLRRR